MVSYLWCMIIFFTPHIVLITIHLFIKTFKKMQNSFKFSEHFGKNLYIIVAPKNMEVLGVRIFRGRFCLDF